MVGNGSANGLNYAILRESVYTSNINILINKMSVNTAPIERKGTCTHKHRKGGTNIQTIRTCAQLLTGNLSSRDLHLALGDLDAT